MTSDYIQRRDEVAEKYLPTITGVRPASAQFDFKRGADWGYAEGLASAEAFANEVRSAVKFLNVAIDGEKYSSTELAVRNTLEQAMRFFDRARENGGKT